jgi:serine/threonine-protein kinase
LTIESNAPAAVAARDAGDLVGKKLGNYRLLRILGRGRMGVVYHAQDEALLRPTAIKVLWWDLPTVQDQDPEVWFLREARAMALINDAHVVQIYGIAKHAGQCYIAMEYVEGAPAHAWLAKQGALLHRDATSIMVQSARALHAAHRVNVVHRDVKPENILVTADRVAKLADFGMARNAGADKAAPMRAGTPFYTAPEIWRGETAGVATDIYALGATYFQLLTGKPPFAGKDVSELRVAHLQNEVPDVRAWNPEIPVACDHIVRRSMAKSPRDRYPSAQSLLEETGRLLQ